MSKPTPPYGSTKQPGWPVGARRRSTMLPDPSGGGISLTEEDFIGKPAEQSLAKTPARTGITDRISGQKKS